jgi:acyl-CoA thioesterase-1
MMSGRFSGRVRRRDAVWCVLAAALLVASCGSSSPAIPSAPAPLPLPPPAIQRVVVLGDSLAVSPSMEQSFPAVLQTRIAGLGLPWTVTNAGISGDTTADGLSRVAPLLSSDVGVLTLELGANDGLRGIEVAAIQKNLSAIIELAQARRIRVLLCGMETPPTHGLSYSIAFHGVFPSLASQYAAPLVPFLLAGVALDPELNGADGVHPKAAGAKLIADTVWPYLEPLLRR